MTQTTTALKANKKQTTTAPSTPVERCTAVIPNFDELPDSALVRLTQLVRTPKNPTKPVPLPFSPATLWRKVATGEFPAPLKISSAVTAWKVSDVRQWLAAQGAA